MRWIPKSEFSNFVTMEKRETLAFQSKPVSLLILILSLSCRKHIVSFDYVFVVHFKLFSKDIRGLVSK